MKSTATVVTNSSQVLYHSIPDGRIPISYRDPRETWLFVVSKSGVAKARRWANSLRLAHVERAVLLSMAGRVDRQYRTRSWYEFGENWVQAGMSVQDIAGELNLSRRRVKQALRNLKSIGLIDWTHKAGYSCVFQLKVPMRPQKASLHER